MRVSFSFISAVKCADVVNNPWTLAPIHAPATRATQSVLKGSFPAGIQQGGDSGGECTAADARAQQLADRISSGSSAEPMTNPLEAALRHSRTGSTTYLVPPELSALTAFLKVRLLLFPLLPSLKPADKVLMQHRIMHELGVWPLRKMQSPVCSAPLESIFSRLVEWFSR